MTDLSTTFNIAGWTIYTNDSDIITAVANAGTLAVLKNNLQFLIDTYGNGLGNYTVQEYSIQNNVSVITNRIATNTVELSATGNLISTINPPAVTPGVPSSTSYTTSIVVVTTAGTVASGANSITFLVRAGIATIGGTSFNAGESVTFTAPENGTLNAIAYDASGGTLVITTIV